MMENDLFQKIRGVSVSNPSYGKGHIKEFVLIKDQYYVYVLFDSGETVIEKGYQANTAFSRKVLVLDDEELNTAVILTLDRYEQAIKEKKQPIISKKETEISTNDIVNILIERVLHLEPIANDLIILYDDELFEKAICEEAFGYLESIIAGANLGFPYKACIVCALSLIALKYYDGDLHTYIEQKYREYRPKTESRYTRSVLQSGIYDAIRDFRESVKYFDPHSYVAIPIILSGVPHYRLKDLFYLSYGIYKQKLLFDEDLSDEQISEKVLETFDALRKKDLVSDSDTIKGSSYLMSRYTQSCIYSRFGEKALSQIVTHCIRLIISYLTRPEDSFTVEPYYREGFAAWVHEFESDEKEKSTFESNRRISQPYLKLVRNSVHLFTGEYSMDDSFDPNNVHICIYNGSQLIEDHLITDPNTIEFIDEDSAMTGYVIGRQELEINGSPLDELAYRIICDDQIIYDSKSRLFRSNLFFDGKGNEIKPGRDYSGELFVITKRSNKEDYGESLTEIYQGKDYYISTIEINNHEIFQFDDEPYIFYKVTSSQFIGYEIPWAGFISFEGKQFPIFNDVTILFPSSYEKEDLLLEIDGKDYRHDDNEDVRFSIQLLSKEYGETWAYRVKVHGLEAGFHTIRVLNEVNGKQIKGANYSIVYDPKIWKSYISKNDSGILYKLSGSFSDSQEILFEYGVPQKELHAFVKRLGHGSLVLYPSSISYSIDETTWFDIDNIFCLCDLPERVNTISICGPRKMSAYYVDKDAAVKKQELSFETDLEYSTKYKLYISYLRTINGKLTATIVFDFGNRLKYLNVRMFPLVLKEECVFSFDPHSNCHTFDIRFKGPSTIKVVIRPVDSDIVLATEIIHSGETIELNDSEIDNRVRYLTISLYGRKYGSLFTQYQDKPFFTFKKHDLGRPKARLVDKLPVLTVEEGRLTERIYFDGVSSIKADILPSGFETPVSSSIIQNGDEVSREIKLLPFNSYCLKLYDPVPGEENSFFETPFYISKRTKVDSPFLKQRFRISTLILVDGRTEKGSYIIRFLTIREKDGQYYLVGSLIDKSNDNSTETVLVAVRNPYGQKYVAHIWRLSTDLEKLQLKNGKEVDGVVLERIEKESWKTR